MTSLFSGQLQVKPNLFERIKITQSRDPFFQKLKDRSTEQKEYPWMVDKDGVLRMGESQSAVESSLSLGDYLGVGGRRS
ncbi:hypothetical protein ACLOJK_036822, partial [Asimina triloba]